MNVAEAVRTRRSVRAFTDQKVERAVLTRILEKAQRSPSGGNTQPWHGIVLTGEPMQRLFDRIAQDLPKGREAFAPEYHVYPPELDGAYEQRRRGVGEDMYGALQISREEKGKRLMWFANNFRAFGAPVLMQTIGLLCREEGLDTCFQEAWAVYSPQIREMVDIPEDHIFFCGVAIGYRDEEAPVNNFEVKRAVLDESVRWEGW